MTLETEKQQIEESLNDFNLLRIDLLKQIEEQFCSVDNLIFEARRNLFRFFGEYNPIPVSFNNNSLSYVVNENGEKEYKVKGSCDLISDMIIPLTKDSEYLVEMEVKNILQGVLTLVGLVSYHGKDKQVITGWQCYATQGSEVKLIGIDEENKALIVDNSNNNLSKWSPGTTNYNYKFIGYYKNGDINAFIPSQYVIACANTEIAAYKEIDQINGKILLTDWGWSQFKNNNIFSEGDLNKVQLMNHIGGCIYQYDNQRENQINYPIPNWTKIHYTVSNFRKFTDQISVCILASHEGQNKSENIFEVRNVTITLIPKSK